MSKAAFKNILLVGAAGSMGSVMLTALQAEPSFTVTVLRRESSKAAAPEGIRSVTVPDSYPTADLVAAFRGQDVVVNCMTSLSVADQLRMVDAALEAGVQRYVPSEFGLNNARPDAQALNSVFADKGRVRARLVRGQDALEWMAVSCGMWLRWSVAHEFLGVHARERRMVFWDDGEGIFSCTTEENTARGLVEALRRRGETSNRNIMLSDFAVSQRELLACIEKVQGAKYTVEHINTDELIREKQEAVRNGDQSATYALIETGFVTGRFGGHLEKEPGEIMNKKLGLEEHTLEEVVKDALRNVGVI
jgi:nucleoside-diphosphate-sugar epimerase